MRLVNNFDKFKWEFKEGEFYLIKVMKRKKDQVGKFRSLGINQESFLVSDKKTFMGMFRAMTDDINRSDYRQRSYHSIAANIGSIGNKWIIDIDNDDENYCKLVAGTILGIVKFRGHLNGFRIYHLPTPNGYHIICDRFDRKSLINEILGLSIHDIKTNGDTILFYHPFAEQCDIVKSIEQFNQRDIAK